MPILQKAECPEFPTDELKGCGREGRLDSVTLPQGKGLLGDRGSVNLSERSQCSPEGGDGRAGASDPTCRSQALKGLLQASSCVSWGLDSWQQQKCTVSAPICPRGLCSAQGWDGERLCPTAPIPGALLGNQAFQAALVHTRGKRERLGKGKPNWGPLEPTLSSTPVCLTQLGEAISLLTYDTIKPDTWANHRVRWKTHSRHKLSGTGPETGQKDAMNSTSI